VLWGRRPREEEEREAEDTIRAVTAVSNKRSCDVVEELPASVGILVFHLDVYTV